MATADEEPPRGESRLLGATTATALVAGSMLGIGIFIAPPDVARQLDHPLTFLLMWAIGGVSALCGALSVAELGAMLPRAGGDYPYLRLAYGPGIAFAAGWLQLLAIFPGSLATMAVGTAQYQLPVILQDGYAIGEAVGLPGADASIWASVIIIGLTLLNHIGIVMSGRLQVVMTGVPVFILVLAMGYVLGSGGGTGLTTGGEIVFPDVGGAAGAFLAVYFAYSGWNAAIFVGGEIRDPTRNVPRALVGGTLGVTLLYLLLCAGFLSVIGVDELARAGEAGSEVAGRLFGAPGKLVVTGLIVMAMIGSINGCILTGSRIAFAMAKEGHFPRSGARLHPRFGTPVVALWAQAAIALVLVASQSFEHLIKYTSAAMLLTGTLTVLAVIVLRQKMPTAARPYRTWGYPFTPLLYATSSVLVLAVYAARIFVDGERDWSVLLALIWFVGALGLHRGWLRRRRGESSPKR